MGTDNVPKRRERIVRMGVQREVNHISHPPRSPDPSSFSSDPCPECTCSNLMSRIYKLIYELEVDRALLFPSVGIPEYASGQSKFATLKLKIQGPA